MARKEVDWALVEEELAGIDDSWKEPRFDTLPHVVDVLTCRDPKEALLELQKQTDNIDVLVDDVVSIYYVGFNKAIHNYSQILSLISESAHLMAGLKDSLGEARRLLGNRHKQLQQLWFRSIMLRHIITLIDQIDDMSKVPARIEALVKEGKLYAAVQLHLQSMASLDREGISAVGGLREVRNELSHLRSQLFIRVLDQLQLHLYGKGEFSPKRESTTTAAILEDDDSDISSIVPVPVPATAPMHPSLAAQGVPTPLPSKDAKYKRKSVRGARADAKGGLSIDTSGGAGAEDESLEGTLSEAGSEASGSASLQGTQSQTQGGDPLGGVAPVRKPAAVLPVWLEDATHNEFVDHLAKSPAPQHVKFLHTMVECLALLGKVAQGGTILSQRVRASVRDLMIAEIRECADAAEAARPRVEQVTKQRHVSASPIAGGASSVALPGTPTPTPRGPPSVVAGLQPPGSSAAASAAATGAPGAGGAGAGAGAAGGGGAGDEGKGLLHDPNGPSQLAAQDVLEAVTKRLTRVLESHVLVAQLMEAKAGPAAKGGGGAPEGVSVLSSHEGELTKFSASTGGYSTPFVWSCIQTECQQLLCDILKANADGTSAEASSKLQKIRIDTSGSSSELRFSFRFAEGTGLTPSDSSLASASSKRQMGGAGSRGLGGPGALGLGGGAAGADSPFGTAAVLQERGIYLTSACYRPTLQFTERVCQMLPPQYADLGRVGLRTFIDAFVKDQFLPSVRADYRAQAAEALCSPSAFRPKAKIIGAYEPRLERGRPVLQGPLAVEALAGEVLKWAVAMPVYASELVSLMHALLERSLERCRAVYTECVLGSLGSTLVGRPDLEKLMAGQGAAKLLEPVESLGRAEVEAAKEEPPPDSEPFDLDLDIFDKLLALCPLREDQLIGDGGKLVALAALSDTLEYIADAVLCLGRRPRGSDTSLPVRRTGSSGPHSQGQQAQALTPELQGLSMKYRDLAKEALRTLRLEMQLQCIFHLQLMEKRSYVNDVDAEEPEDFIVALTTQMTRLDEEMTVYLSPPRRYYVFGGVCSLAAHGLIRALKELPGINSLGVRQVQRNCIALQQTLTTLNANSSQSVQLSLDRVGEYYELLNRPYEALMAYVKDHSRYFSPDEYLALLQVNVPGRVLPSDAVAQMSAFLRAY